MFFGQISKANDPKSGVGDFLGKVFFFHGLGWELILNLSHGILGWESEIEKKVCSWPSFRWINEGLNGSNGSSWSPFRWIIEGREPWFLITIAVKQRSWGSGSSRPSFRWIIEGREPLFLIIIAVNQRSWGPGSSWPSFRWINEGLDGSNGSSWSPFRWIIEGREPWLRWIKGTGALAPPDHTFF